MTEYLSANGIEFTYKDVMIDEDARDELMDLGVRSTPATLIGKEVIVGFDRGKIDALLNL